MRLTSALVAAQLSVLALSAPSSKKDDAFSLKQLTNSKFQGIDGPTALMDAFAKYGKPPPAAMRQAMQENPELAAKFNSRVKTSGKSSTSAAAYPAPYFDSQYVVPVQIGTPPQTTYLNLDTGSADLWVFSTDTYGPSVQGQTLYRPKSSKTSKRMEGQSWSIWYGDGSSASGIVYQDKLTIGDISFATQAVESAVQVSQAISSDSFASGILGLGRSTANTVRPKQQKTWIDNVLPKLKSPLFTANLLPQRPGSYNFGFIDKTQYTGNIKYVPMDPNSLYWELTVDGYKVGKNAGVRPQRWQAIVDTGTTLLLVPKNIVTGYYSRVKGAGIDSFSGMMVFPCDAWLPEFVIVLGGYRGIVPGPYINYGRSNRTHCYGGIQDSEGIGIAILGDVFLKAQFVVFDLGRQLLGFANKKTYTK